MLTYYSYRFWPYFSSALSYFVGMTITNINRIIQKLTDLLTFLQPIKKYLPSLILLLLFIPASTFYPTISVAGSIELLGFPDSPILSPSPILVTGLRSLIQPGLRVTPGLIEASHWITQNLPRNELIHVVGSGTGNLFSHLACEVSMLTGNPVTGGLWGETVPLELQAQLEDYIKYEAWGYFLCRESPQLQPGDQVRAHFGEIYIFYRPPPP
jgi:hypothetical protein